jgi:hypothetical protein
MRVVERVACMFFVRDETIRQILHMTLCPGDILEIGNKRYPIATRTMTGREILIEYKLI